MEEKKYFYKGKPIKEYCEENNINVNSIRTRIWKKKKNPKYDKYSEQEIVNMVIEAYGKKTKYMYEGVSLEKYCKENNISVVTIRQRIIKLKEEYNDLDNDKLVIMAIENYQNKNYKYFYKGMPLVEYCKQSKDLSYSTIKDYIQREIKKHPTTPYEEIISEYINKKHKGRCRYYYNGIPLIEYCEQNKVNYKRIISAIKNNKDKEEYKDLDDDELINKIMKKYLDYDPIKYTYKGITLRKYCKDNNISYYSVVSYIKRDNTDRNIDEKIEEAVNSIKKNCVTYYYNNIPLIEYCKDKEINYSYICSIIRKEKNKSNKPLQHIVNMCVESYKIIRNKYTYNEIPLVEYCKQNNLNYSSIVHAYCRKYKGTVDLLKDEHIKEIVEYYKNNDITEKKYYVGDKTLWQYCKENNYCYYSIIDKLYRKPDVHLSTEERMEKAIIQYKEKLKIKKINEIFNNLDNVTDINRINEICNYLKIDINNMNELVSMNLSYDQAINIIWYFYDKEENNIKSISINKLKYLSELVIKYKNTNNTEELDIYELIGIYKSKLYDTRTLLLFKQNKYLHKVLYNYANMYNIYVNKDILIDFEDELKSLFLLFIERTNLNITPRIIKYMDMTIKGYFLKYIKDYIRSYEEFSLDVKEFDSDSKNNRCKIDNVEDTCNYNIEEFSDKMMNIIDSLPEDYKEFIILRYKECYSYKELEEYYNISRTDLLRKEKMILLALKNNDKIKRR